MKKKQIKRKKRHLSFPLRFQIIAVILLVVVLVAGISLGFVTLFTKDYSFGLLQRELTEDADMLARYLGEISPNNAGIVNAVSDKIVKRDFAIFVLSQTGEIVNRRNTDSLEELIDGSLNETVESSLSTCLARDGGYRMTIGGQEFAVGVRSIMTRTESQLGYAVVIGQNKEFSGMQNAIGLYVISIGVSSVFAVFVAFLLSYFMTRKLRILKTRARMLALRQYDGQPALQSRDEIGELAQSFEEMANDIRTYDRTQKIFLQNAAHELRTPLMSIRGYVEGLRDGVFTDTAESYDNILGQVNRLEKLVNEVLYLSKIETAEQEDRREHVSLYDITEEVSRRMRGVSVGSNITIDYGNIPVATVNADVDMIATAFSNIITNDLRYAKEKITFEWTAERDTVTVKITDDGNGFHEEDIPHLFERFYKGSKGNFGLGLSICKAIVEAHCGTISAYNRENGRCATFEICLPLCGE